MTSPAVTGVRNVEATLNTSWAAAVAAFALPSHLTRPNVVFHWENVTASMPCYGVIHIPISMDSTWQGRVAGDTQTALVANAFMEISAFVTRDRNPNYMAQLNYMRDMVASWVTSTKSLVIKNFATPSTPVDTAYRVMLLRLDEQPTAPDVNPSVIRARMLLEYRWFYRM